MEIRFIPKLVAALLIAVFLIGCTPVGNSDQSQKTPSASENADQKPSAVNGVEDKFSNSSKTSDGNANTALPTLTSDVIQQIPVSAILENGKAYDKKTVIVQGKIVNECGSGCWFTLKEGNAIIYIDLAPSNLVIPQKKGSNAKVTAVVVNEGSDVYLIGKKVEF